MRIWKDKPKKFTRCMLASGIAFGLLHAVNAIATGDIFAALVQVIYTAAIGVFDGAIFLRTRNIWGVILMHTLTDISAFIAVFDESIHVTGMDIVFCIFGSLVFIALAFYLIRPAKRAEMEALWADGWSFGNENGKTRAGAKAAVVISTAVVIAFVASLGVTIYQVKMQEEKPNQREQFKMPKERISKYFAPGTPAQKIEDTIIKALELYRRRERQRDMER